MLFAALREARQLARGRLKLAIASLSPAEERARAVLHACGLHSTSAEGAEGAEGAAGAEGAERSADWVGIGCANGARDKSAHLAAACAALGAQPEQLLLFDDDWRCVHAAREQGCLAQQLERARGLTDGALLRGLEQMAARRAGGGAGGAADGAAVGVADMQVENGNGTSCEGASTSGAPLTKEVMPPHIAAIQGDEKRRKAFQAYQGNDEEKKARSRDGQHAAALARLEAPTGCWLAAPLKLPRASSSLSSSSAAVAAAAAADAATAAADADAAAASRELDWDFMRLASRLFATCEWPTLEQTDDALVQLESRGDGSGGGSLRMCALAATSRQIVLTDVSIDGAGTVSGCYQKRGRAAGRLRVQDDGRWVNRESKWQQFGRDQVRTPCPHTQSLALTLTLTLTGARHPAALFGRRRAPLAAAHPLAPRARRAAARDEHGSEHARQRQHPERQSRWRRLRRRRCQLRRRRRGRGRG